MLTKESQKKLLKLLGVADDQITELVDATEEKEATIPDGLKIFTAEAYATLETNLKDGGKTKYIRDGKEIAIKDLKEKLGLDYEGKDPDVFLQKYKESILSEAGKAPDAKDEQIRTLQQHLQESKTQLSDEKNRNAALARDTEWLKKFPKDRSATMSDEDRLLLLKNKLEIDTTGEKPVYKYKGAPMTDELTNPLSVDDVLPKVFKEEGWLSDTSATPPVGNGGGGNPKTPGFYNSMDDVKGAMKEKGINPLTKEGREFVEAATKANPKMTVQVS